jgi:hypothetical protein
LAPPPPHFFSSARQPWPPLVALFDKSNRGMTISPIARCGASLDALCTFVMGLWVSVGPATDIFVPGSIWCRRALLVGAMVVARRRKNVEEEAPTMAPTALFGQKRTTIVHNRYNIHILPLFWLITHIVSVQRRLCGTVVVFVVLYACMFSNSDCKKYKNMESKLRCTAIARPLPSEKSPDRSLAETDLWKPSGHAACSAWLYKYILDLSSSHINSEVSILIFSVLRAL